MAGFGGKAAPAPAGGKTSRLARILSAGRDAPATSHWSIRAATKPAAPANTCTDIIHANQCTALMALPQSPCRDLIIYTPPATMHLPTAFAASPPITPTAASTKSADACAAEVCTSAAAAIAAAAWPTLDLEFTAEEVSRRGEKPGGTVPLLVPTASTSPASLNLLHTAP